MSLGWGLTPWGLSPWGLATFSLLSARVLDTNTVIVEVSAPAKAQAAYATGDALNPLVWTVTDTITGQVFTVLSVSAANNLDTVFEIHTLEHLGPHVDVHTVAAPTLVSALGAALFGSTTLTFGGVEATENASTAITAKTVDLENAGTYRITSAGDYAEQSGGKITRKLILRRLTTLPGGFFYLTEYGLGVRIKEPVTLAMLVKLKAEIERQVKHEPEVQAVTASLALLANNTVIGTLRVRLLRGTDTEEIPLTVGGGIQF